MVTVVCYVYIQIAHKQGQRKRAKNVKSMNKNGFNSIKFTIMYIEKYERPSFTGNFCY